MFIFQRVITVKALLFFMLIFTFSGNASGNKQKILSNKDCLSCHEKQYNQWQQSDHAKAMAVADEKSVLGNFNQTTIKHFSQQATFYIKNEQYWVEYKQADKSDHYQINYVFGYFPLQQYLIATEHGKYQVLPFSWDSRPESEGGQKWFANYADEDIKPNDRLHWLQPLQNWNGMCADCHSDGLKRNYNLQKNSFKTHWDNINVGCQSCHGQMTIAHTQIKNSNAKHQKNSSYDKEKTPTKLNAQWLIKAGNATATWQGEKRNNNFMDTCFACHALRSPLTDGIKASDKFLDQFSPSFLQPNLYHADGQIKEEVYVYGSFLQSKMYAAGVNCVDCHNAHTMAVKINDNGLCLQCHSSEVFAQKTHHGHDTSSQGSQCVNCHMPENTYMGVDDRRDHSFKIPRPHLSNNLKTPNACTQCHNNKSNQWAAENIEQWHGKAKPLTTSEKSYHALQQYTAITLTEHFNLINDETLPVIKRATAITLLANSTTQLTNQQIEPWVKHKEPLIRLAIARVAALVPVNERYELYHLLLDDPYKAVRVEIANHLIMIPQLNKTQLKKAFDELTISHEVNAWRGEGRLNQSRINLPLGQIKQAIATLKKAIEIDPYFPVSYINLVDIYRQQGNLKEETATFKAAMKAIPEDDLLLYSYGMHNIRIKKLNTAINSFAKALKIQPNNSQYAYIYLLALDSNKQTKLALAKLKIMATKFKDNAQMMQLGLSFAQKLQDRKSYHYFYQLIQQSTKN